MRGGADICGPGIPLRFTGRVRSTFGFPFATSLPDPKGLLEGTGKNMRHVKLRSAEDLEKKGLRELIVAASRFEGGAAMQGMGAKKAKSK